jgi:hypothetical protein
VKKWIVLLVLALAVFVVWRRQRVFVRDPIASVMRDGAKTSGEQVYINFTNDVMLEKDSAPMMVMLIQRGQPIGVPVKMHCIHWVACLMDADVATTLPLGGDVESMSGKSVSFRDADGQEWVVRLR